MINNLAPIVLFVYNRPWHTKQTIEALQKNELANESELFIYSDEAKNENARTSVDKVRKFINSIDRFKKVTIIKREKNWGLANSVIDGVTKIVNEYGKIIVLEDDLVTSPYFLKFMNDALEFYKNEKNIMSISGYTYPFDMPREYNKDVFLFYRSSSWGWAIWQDKWNKINFDLKKEDEIFKNISLQKRLNLGGDDLYEMLKNQLEGKINSWAIRFALYHSLFNSMTVYSVQSLVQNIGHDNSGTHCGISNMWDVSIDNNYLPILSNIDIDNKIAGRLLKKLNKTLLQKIKSKMRKIFK
jgi:GT2 family glycosyltransferase